MTMMDAQLIQCYGIFYAVSMYGIFYSQFKSDCSYSGTDLAYLLHMFRCYRFYRSRATHTVPITDP